MRPKVHRRAASAAFLVACWWFWLFSVPFVVAETAEQASTTCAFQDGKQVSIHYDAIATTGELPKGSVWKPGGAPLTLFSQANLVFGGSRIPLGAYSLYVIPDDAKWMLIVNKNVISASQYETQQDVVRIPMETAHLSQPVKRLQLVFGKVAPKQCNLRIYYGNVGVYGAQLKEE